MLVTPEFVDPTVDPSSPSTGAFDRLAWTNRFVALSPRFGTRLAPKPLPDPYLVALSDDAARSIGLDASSIDASTLEVLVGNRVPRGADPMAAVYSGHQFGVWAGQLGDGRAHLLGGVDAPNDIVELQLKGAGKTPYSRMGDGRAVLRSSIREFLCSEAMHGLGIPTTRALAVTGSDQPVVRETVETAAVVLRMAPSFIRFGSFEHWSSKNDVESLRVLADAVIDTFYPDARHADHPYRALLAAVVERTADLIVRWQSVGFCHGVMNTDNMSILGLTLDYGPFGFLDGFDANHICNHTDEQGRYAFSRQPAVARWNCYCLAEALMPLIDDVDAAEAALAPYRARFEAGMDRAIHAKLGLERFDDGDQALIDELFTILHTDRADFTLFFRRLCDFDRAGTARARDLFIDVARFDAWADRYRERLSSESRDVEARRVAMRATNPKYVLRNHLAETAIEAARAKDFSEVRRLHRVLEHPFDEQPEFDAYAELPPEWAGRLEVSCSS